MESDVQVESAELDSKIEAAVMKLQSKLEADYAARLKEQERLGKLSEDERAAAELEATRSALAAKEAELKRKEQELEITNVLNQRGIPLEFKTYFIAEDSESILKRIKSFENLFKAKLEAAVNERLKGTAPVAAGKVAPSKGFMDVIRKNQIAR